MQYPAGYTVTQSTGNGYKKRRMDNQVPGIQAGAVCGLLGLEDARDVQFAERPGRQSGVGVCWGRLKTRAKTFPRFQN